MYTSTHLFMQDKPVKKLKQWSVYQRAGNLVLKGCIDDSGEVWTTNAIKKVCSSFWGSNSLRINILFNREILLKKRYRIQITSPTKYNYFESLVPFVKNNNTSGYASTMQRVHPYGMWLLQSVFTALIHLAISLLHLKHTYKYMVYFVTIAEK